MASAARPTATKPRSAARTRIDLRLNKDLKALLTRAAMLSGNPSLSSFILTTLQEKSLQIVDTHDRVMLTRQDWQSFIQALEQPPKPNAALRALVKRHRKTRAA